MYEAYLFVEKMLKGLYVEIPCGHIYYYLKEDTLVGMNDKRNKIINLYFTEDPDLPWEYDEKALVKITESLKITEVVGIDENNTVQFSCENAFDINNLDDKLEEFNVFAFKHNYALGSIGKGSYEDGNIILEFEDAPFSFMIKVEEFCQI